MSKQAHKEKPETTDVAVSAPANVPAVLGSELSLDELRADAGRGMQNMTANDLAMPIIRVLQSNSPQCKRSEGAYIAGAVDGTLFNNVTNEIFDGALGIKVVPIFWEKVYLEWKPNRGGFAGLHPVDTPLKDQATMKADEQGKMLLTLPNGNTLSETNQHYVFVIKEDGSFEPAVISMSSSQLKTSRIWGSLMKKVFVTDDKGALVMDRSGAPIPTASFYATYKLTTKVTTRDKNSWYVFSVEPAGKTPATIYRLAREFETAVSSGKVTVKVDDHMQAEHEAAPTGGAAPASSADVDDSIPF